MDISDFQIDEGLADHCDPCRLIRDEPEQSLAPVVEATIEEDNETYDQDSDDLAAAVGLLNASLFIMKALQQTEFLSMAGDHAAAEYIEMVELFMSGLEEEDQK